MKTRVLCILSGFILLFCSFNATPVNAQFLRTFQGTVGTTVTAYGLTPGESYIIDWNDYLTVIGKGNIPDSGEVSFTVPKATGGVHYVYVYSPLGDTTAEIMALYTVLPSLTLEPASGAVGTKVKVSGSGFGRYEEDIKLKYGGTSVVTSEIKADVDGTFTASFIVPSSISGNHSLDGSGPKTTSGQVNASFAVTPSIALSTRSGTPGSSVIVTGTGFDALESGITVTFDGKSVLSGITAGNSGSWSGKFTVPASANGSHNVVAYGNVSTRQAGTRVDFTVSGSTSGNDPAVTILAAPEIKSPVNGSRQGLLGKTRLNFEWTAVAGAVTYDLQLGANNDFNSVLIDKTKLTSTTYKSSESEALPDGKYYFRVRAVDASGNPGKWTDAAVVETGIGIVMLIIYVAAIVIIIALIIFGAFRIFRKKKS
jgi:hypothetical protein